MKNKIEDLRNHLFAQIERLSDDECDLEKEVTKASAIIKVADSIMDTGRLEIAFLEATSQDAGNSTGFFPIAREQRKYFIEKDTGKTIETEEENQPFVRPKAEYSNKPFSHSQIFDGEDIK